LIKCSQSTIEDEESEKNRDQLDKYFQEMILVLKDRVRLSNNRKEIEEAQITYIQENIDSKHINFNSLLDENSVSLEKNQEEAENLISKMQDLRKIIENNTESKENLNNNYDYYEKREMEIRKEILDLKIDNLELKSYLANIKSKYSNDSEIQELKKEKQMLRERMKKKKEDVSKVQTGIFLRNKEIIELKKQATSNINTLVIHFQTDILNKVNIFYNKQYRCKIKYLS